MPLKFARTHVVAHEGRSRVGSIQGCALRRFAKNREGELYSSRENERGETTSRKIHARQKQKKTQKRSLSISHARARARTRGGNSPSSSSSQSSRKFVLPRVFTHAPSTRRSVIARARAPTSRRVLARTRVHSD